MTWEFWTLGFLCFALFLLTRNKKKRKKRAKASRRLGARIFQVLDPLIAYFFLKGSGNKGNFLAKWGHAVDRWVYYTYNRWVARQYFGGRRIRTRAGIRVRSKAEKQIVDLLHARGIRFEYERPIQVQGHRMLPDFYLLDFDVYIEYWGLADVNADYDKRKSVKIARYKSGDLKLISLYPRHLKTLEESLATLFEAITKTPFPASKRGG